ncbi:unnamed protein product [Phaeothamnion confervicola]
MRLLPPQYCLVFMSFACLNLSILKRPTQQRRLPSPFSEQNPFGTSNLNSRQLDHFGAAPGPGGVTTFSQRWLLCGVDNWRRRATGQPGPIFFYAGNEADVELYVNASGLMWESAPDFGALLVFAEHRYYGETLPFGEASMAHLQWLSTEQALADYAVLVTSIKEELGARNAPVVAFGGSYGGMLAAWMRLKYPHAICGAVAASAPIFAFPGLDPPADPNAYADIVSAAAEAPDDDAPAAAAAAVAAAALPPRATCRDAVRAAWGRLSALAGSAGGRKKAAAALGLCGVPDSAADMVSLAQWLSDAFSFMAMGNFPYPSAYVLDGVGMLPAWPMRVSCARVVEAVAGLDGRSSGAYSRNGGAFVAGRFGSADSNGSEDDETTRLLRGLGAAASVYYNASGAMTCLPFGTPVNNESSIDGELWNYQSCTEMVIPMSMNGVTDMFWPAPWDEDAFEVGCRAQFGVTPKPYWAVTEYGGRSINTLSNVVFSNGLLDPWSGFGVDAAAAAAAGPDVMALPIANGAHHLDLMFSDPADPPSVVEARRVELAAVRRWIDAEYASQAEQGQEKEVAQVSAEVD